MLHGHGLTRLARTPATTHSNSGSSLLGSTHARLQTGFAYARCVAVSAPAQLRRAVRRDSPGLQREMSTRFTLDFPVARLAAQTFVLYPRLEFTAAAGPGRRQNLTEQT